MSKTTRAKKLVHYICAKCDDPAKLGATKLNKVLWYCDTIAYRMRGQTISGDTSYIKRQFGPVPKRIQEILAELQNEKALLIRESEFFGKVKRDFIALKPADMSDFTDDEREIIDEVLKIICDQFTAVSISELSHDIIWDAAEIGEEIPIHAVLAAHPEAITKDDKAWAEKVVSKRRKAA